MPSLKEVRKRISSVKSTQKITRAMKLVAAAKLRRAQDEIIAARPYSNALAEVAAQLAARSGPEPHPLFEPTAGKNPMFVVLTSDRGLCGGFNTNVCRTIQRTIKDGRADGQYTGTRLSVVGRKGREYFSRRKLEVNDRFAGAIGATAGERAKEIALTVTDAFLNGSVDSVQLVYNEFRSAISQRVTIEQLLPIKPADLPADVSVTDFTAEPSMKDVLGSLLPLYVQSRIHRALLESIASEFGARMTAMDNATKNAKDMIERLSLAYNRARQAAITKELMEIVGGAEALKG